MTMRNDMTYDEYDAAPGLRASELKHGVKSMLHMHHYVICGQEETTAMRMGRLIHCAVLEPEVFASNAVVWTGKVRRGKEWDAFCDECDPAWCITPTEHADLLGMSAVHHGNRHASNLISRTEHEVSMFWDDEIYGAGKVRLDGYSARHGIVEYKTTGNVEPWAFASTCAKMHYDIQIGWGHHGAALNCERKDLPYHIISQEQKAPYDVIVYRVPDSVIDAGYAAAEDIARRYRISETVGIFDGIASEIMPLEWPAWAGGTAGGWEPTEGGE